MSGSIITKPLPNDFVIEITKQRMPPIKLTPSRLDQVLEVEKEFNELLMKYYEKARTEFLKKVD